MYHDQSLHWHIQGGIKCALNMLINMCSSCTVTYFVNVLLYNLFMYQTVCVWIMYFFSFPTDCPLTITTEDLPPGLDCYIPSSCTAVYCCLNATVPFRRSLSTFLDIDPCNQRLLIGIENFIHSISLYDIVFGMYL